MNKPELKPYPGLRPFERHESRIFFGREEQVDELLLRLKTHHFLAVLGASGSGKSSLVKAGLLPGLAKGYMGEAGSRWSIAEMRPGDQPFVRLAEGLLADKAFRQAWGNDQAAFLAAELRRGARSLHEVLNQAPLPDGAKLLILADQFEELFRFREQQENQAAAFVALLLEACQHADIYIVITMRSDFLGAAAEFHGLPEAINDGLYLTPRLTREQLHDAICLPAQLFGGSVDDTLANALQTGTMLDISHESLIRQWQRLQDWAIDENEKSAMYLRLLQAEQLHRKNKGELWYGLDLTSAKQWLRDKQPNPFWASRYGSQEDFEKVLAFIASSEQQQSEKDKEIAELYQKQTEILFDAYLSNASLECKAQDFLSARKSLAKTYALDEKIPSTRRHARNLLAGFINIMGGEAQATLTDNNGQPLPALVGGVAISSDGQWLAAAGERGTVALFDRAGGKLVQKLTEHDATAGNNGSVRSVIFHPQQPWLFSTGDDRRIIVWSLPQADQQAVIAQQWSVDSKALSLAIDPDGHVLASGHVDGSIRLWRFEASQSPVVAIGNTDDPQPWRELKGHKNQIAEENGLTFSPDGRILASASYDDTVRMWNLQDEKAKPKVLKHKGINTIAFSLDGRWLASGSDDSSIVLWNTQTGQKLRTLKGHENMVFNLKFVDEDLLASASFDQTIRLWDVHTGVTRRILQGHIAGAVGLKDWQDQGQRLLYSTANDGTVKRWSTKLNGQWLVNLSEEPKSLAISPGGDRIAIGFADGKLAVFLLNDKKTEYTFSFRNGEAHKSGIKRLAFNSDGTRIATGDMQGIVKIWSVHSESTSQDKSLVLDMEFNNHDDVIHDVIFSPDDTQLATASYDGRIGLFSLSGEQEPLLFEAHQGSVASVSFDITGKQLLSAGIEDSTLKLWNLDQQPPVEKTLATANDKLMWSSLSPDGTLVASAGREHIVSVHATHGSSEPLHLIGHEQAVFKTIFSPDNRQLATVSGDMTVRLWDLDTRSELFRLRLPYEFNSQSPLWDFDFRCTPTGCWIAVPLTSGKLALYNLGKINYD